jgi:hypothetical protein
VTSLALPSLVTVATVPVSAIPKLAPVMPMSAVRNFSRRRLRAKEPRASTSGGSSSPAVRDRTSVHVQDGADDVRGRVARELRDPLPKVGLDDLEVEVSIVLLEPAVQFDLLRRHALGLGDDLRAPATREIPYVADDVLAVGCKEHVAAARLDGACHLLQVAVEVGHGLLLYAVGPLP